ncbi:MAG TPA: DNA polymerase/3'-5' exonuclease PolX [Tepidisphaeraceae bacterium]|nr:DNA polymerase/3'-5' exonuclease PolX [Tepidisphaeraceae bacterium]
MSLNEQLAELFHSLAALMELRGDNVFKVIAFQKVGRIIRDSNIDFKKCMEEGKLCEIEGIGKGSQQIIEEFIQTGKSAVFEEVATTVPAGLVPLMSIEGLGPKTINMLWKERGITGLAELEEALASGALKGVKGLGEKKLTTIKAGIDRYKSAAASGPVQRRTGIPQATEQGEALLAEVRKIQGVVRAELAGSLRRRRETIADLDIVAAINDPTIGGDVSAAFCNLPGTIQTIVTGQSKCSVRIANGMQADLRIVPEENFGAALLYFTGSKEHNVKIRSLALKKKMTLNEWGLYRLEAYEDTDKQPAKPPPVAALASATETDIYQALGLSYIEPELREDRGEIDAARENRLPKLLTLSDIRGDLHAHTTESDGTASIEQMALAAKALGYEFLAITDHSKALAMTNGLSPERLLAHVENVHRISDKLKGITLLAGSEVDILADGRMDYDDDVLKELDIVIASPHISLKQDTRKATDRLLRAIDNRYVNVIGHPTGRLINGRDGLPLELERIFKSAAKTGTAMEINASYPRLDLSDVNAKNAHDAGVMISINTDAHSTGEFYLMPFGIDVARRAWLTPKDVINCMPLATLRKFLAAKRGR